jgi:ABC-type molybdenum transport system ATPase subunit/photorepair protein PhrA
LVLQCGESSGKRIINEKNLKDMLEIKGLHASINGKEILKGIDFSVKAG